MKSKEQNQNIEQIKQNRERRIQAKERFKHEILEIVFGPQESWESPQKNFCNDSADAIYDPDDDSWIELFFQMLAVSLFILTADEREILTAAVKAQPRR